jgi:aminoglycoside 6-adenylyltransferase
MTNDLMREQTMFSKLFNWAQSDDTIQAMLLVGSRAHNAHRVDVFSDFDLALFVDDPQKYVSDDAWMRGIDDVLVYIPEKVCVDGKEYPTRLVIFKYGIKVDFAFYSIDVIKNLAHQEEQPAQYALGYKVLLDKDNLTAGMKSPTFKIQATPKPSQQEFENLVSEFFFEVYHVAKHLCRNDLWHAKFRDWTTKELLLRMIEWHEKSTHGWDYDTSQHGKRMQEWVSKETWAELNNCFAHFDADDSWKALIATSDLFRTVAMQTAERLGYRYPMGVDKNITIFVQQAMVCHRL